MPLRALGYPGSRYRLRAPSAPADFLCLTQMCSMVLQDGVDLEERGRRCLFGGTKPYCSEGKRARAYAALARVSPARPPLATITPAPNSAHGRRVRASCPSSAEKPGRAGWWPQSAQHGLAQPYAKQGASMRTQNAACNTSACQGVAEGHVTAKQSGSPVRCEFGEQAGAGSAHAECGPHGGRGEELDASESEALEVLASLRMLAAGPGPGSGSGSLTSGRVGAAASAVGGALRAGSGRVRKRPVRCPAADASAHEDSSSEDGGEERGACRRPNHPHPPQRAASARAAAAAAARSEVAAEAEACLISLIDFKCGVQRLLRFLLYRATCTMPKRSRRHRMQPSRKRPQP